MRPTNWDEHTGGAYFFSAGSIPTHVQFTDDAASTASFTLAISTHDGSIPRTVIYKVAGIPNGQKYALAPLVPRLPINKGSIAAAKGDVSVSITTDSDTKGRVYFDSE